MAEEYAAISISPQVLDALDNEYVTLSKRAHGDLTYESDYQAAFRVPAAFLKNPSNFELTFDRILFHLDEAHRKSEDKSARIMVSRASDDLFHGIISIIQFRIDNVERENKKGLFKKIYDSISNFADNFGSNLIKFVDPRLAVGATLAPEVLNLSRAFFEFILMKWEIKREVTFFYNQLANVYQKILNSKSFSHEHGLIRNTFAANKERVLKYVTEGKGLTAAINLMRFDQSDIEKQDSGRIILRTLIDNREWEKCADLLHEMKTKRVGNFREMRDEYLRSYKTLLDHKSKNNKNGPQKDVLTAYPTQEAMMYRINGDGTGYDSYIKKYKRNKQLRTLLGAIALVAICSGLYGYYTHAKSIYMNTARKESARIGTALTVIDTCVNSHNYHTAIKTLNDDLYWKEKSLFDADDEKYTSGLKREKSQNILDSMLQYQQQGQLQIMNHSNYNYITQNLMPLYSYVVQNILDLEAKKVYSEKLKPQLKELDRTRDSYLVQLQINIKSKIHAGAQAEAADMIKDLYHLSDEKYKADGFIDGLFADSFKLHWQKERDKLLELINNQKKT